MGNKKINNQFDNACKLASDEVIKTGKLSRKVALRFLKALDKVIASWRKK